MSIGIADWRMRIGCFLPSSKDSHSLSCLRSKVFLTFNVKRYLLLCSILLLLSGDVEMNPGPELYNIVFLFKETYIKAVLCFMGQIQLVDNAYPVV